MLYREMMYEILRESEFPPLDKKQGGDQPVASNG